MQGPGWIGDFLGWAATPFRGWLGSEDPLAQREPRMMPASEEKVRAGPRIPNFLPNYDSLQNLGETQEMRLAYRYMLSDPNVKAAMLGKLLGVMSLELNAQAASDDARDKEIAEFVEWNLTRRLESGIEGLAWHILSGALIDGFSVNEKVWGMQDRGRWEGKRVLRQVKPKDVDQDIVLLVDEYRNISGVMGLRYNAGEVWNRKEFLIYSHLGLYGNPTGMSDFRAIYGRYWLLDTILKLRAMGAEKRYLPIAVGEYQDVTQQSGLERALATLKLRNWLAVPKDTKVQVLDLAGSSETYFSNFCKDLKEDIFLGIQLATLQALVGGEGQQRGSSAVHQDTSQQAKQHLAKALCHVINDAEFGLVPDMVDQNFLGVGDYPIVSLAGLDDADLADSLTIDTGLKALGIDLSKADLYERYGRKLPKNDEDRLQGGASAPSPGGGGAGGLDDLFGADGSGPAGGAKPPPPPPKLPSPAQRAQQKTGFTEFAEGEPHDYSTVMFVLPGEFAADVLALTDAIPDDELADKGREDQPHITVKYGLHTNDPEEVAVVVQESGPVRVLLGELAIFSAEECDVLKIDVRSAGLQALNHNIADSLEHTDSHPEYQPRITLAYLQPGEGEKYCGPCELTGETRLLTRLVFSDQDGEQTRISLNPYNAATAFADKPKSDWTAYTGPRGGKGWKHSRTGRVVYGGKAPGTAASKANVVNAKRIAAEWQDHLWHRGGMSRLAKQAVKGGLLHEFHPGEITVYRGESTGSNNPNRSGTSWTKSKSQAIAYSKSSSGGGRIREFKITHDTPAIDVNKLSGPSKHSHEQEVFIAKGAAKPAPKVEDLAKRIGGLMRGEKMKATDVKALSQDLQGLKISELRELKDKLGVKGGRTKEEHASKIAQHVKTQAKATPADKIKPQPLVAPKKVETPAPKPAAHVAKAAEAYKKLFDGHAEVGYEQARQRVAALVAPLSVADSKELLAATGGHKKLGSKKAVAEELTRRVHEAKATADRVSSIRDHGEDAAGHQHKGKGPGGAAEKEYAADQDERDGASE
jgi:hypothetical protein